MERDSQSDQPQPQDGDPLGEELRSTSGQTAERPSGDDAHADRQMDPGNDQSEGERVKALLYEGLDNDIQSLSRAPFRGILAEWVRGAPTQEDFRKLAEKQPDRAMQAGSIAAKMAGYQESAKVEHEHNINVKIQQMSDAELYCELNRMLSEAMQQLPEAERKKLMAGEAIDVEFEEV